MLKIKAGRDQPNLTADLSQITNRQSATITGVPIAAAIQAGIKTPSSGSMSSLHKMSSGSLKNLSKTSTTPRVVNASETAKPKSDFKRPHDMIKSSESLYATKK